MSEFVYNPDDEADEFTFNGTKFVLAPNQVTPVDIPRDAEDAPTASHWEGVSAQDIAAHAEVTLGRWGVRWIPRTVFLSRLGAGKTEYEEILAEAEEVYKTSTEKWATDVILGYHERATAFAGTGLPMPKMTSEEVTAKTWLQTHGLLTQE
jgi:hypothetical protein